MRYEEAYANVPLGLKEAPEYLRSAHQSKLSRCIVEALSIDPDTPIGVYTDLLGWTEEDLENYRKWFFCIDLNMPRLQLYEFICSAPEATDWEKARKDMLVNVFEYGWSYIDSKYNKSNRIHVTKEVETNVKKLFGGLNTMVEHCMQKPTAAGMRALVAFMKEGVIAMKSIDVNQDPEKELTLGFVEEIQNEVKEKPENATKIMSVEFDSLMRLKPPEGEAKKELDQILEDTAER